MKTLSVLLLMTLSFIAAAESTVTFQSMQSRTYTISPRSVEEIPSEVMRRSPIRAGKDAVNKHTDWRLTWSYRTSIGPDSCQIIDQRTKVRIKHALPRLNPYVTDPKIINAFHHFLSELKQNKKRDGNKGQLAARELENAISRIPPQADCRTLSRLVDKTAKEIIEKYSQPEDKQKDGAKNRGPADRHGK